jgi:electron transport complex protein RnfB
MSSDVYKRLRECLNEYSMGFGETATGIEYKVLKRFFTEEEAEMYLNLTLDLQSAQEVAEKTNQDPEKVEKILQQMMEKGLVFPRFPKKEGEPFYYAAAPYAHGIIEHQLHKFDKELADLLQEHIESPEYVTKPLIPLRNIPVQTAIDNVKSISSYDNVREIIKNKKRIALAECVDAEWQRVRGVIKCDQPTEVCIFFDFYAQYYVDRGMGRWITPEEAMAKLDECEEYGLVPQLSNSKEPEALCNCCPKCCSILRAYKQHPTPGLFVATNHFAQIEPDLCIGCEICVDRCPMDAIDMEDELAVVNRERCIGCGLCVSKCPEEAIALQEKPEVEHIEPPENCEFMRSSAELEKRFK